MESETVGAIEHVLRTDRAAREEQLARFERACELHAVAILLEAETFGPSGSAMPIANKVATMLKQRGVLP